MVRVEVGNRIKELRESRNYTREQLAEKAEISSKFLYEIEKGSKGISADTLLKIAKTLSCSCDYILTGQKKENEQSEQVSYLLERFDEKDRKYIVKLLTVMKEMCEESSR